jgi:hypothetical protein
MCWSGEASTVLAAIGLGSTAYAAYKKEPPAIWICLGYFSLMEALQAYTYTVINQCSLPANQVATLLGYLHIAFQPFFANAIALHFINEKVRKKIQGSVYVLCFIVSIIMIFQIYPFDWAGTCIPGRPLCGPMLCSLSGNWHIAWSVPTNDLNVVTDISGFFTYKARMNMFAYTLVVFVLPILYGSWRFTFYHLLMGPLLASALTSNNNEWPAVWCLLSIGLLLLVVKTPIRQIMYVKHWWLWRCVGIK